VFDVVDLIEQMGEVVNNVLEMVKVISKSIHDGSSRSNVKELVNWSFHDGI
jgi:t-SNARE complex subunit (syntaxin)